MSLLVRTLGSLVSVLGLALVAGGCAEPVPVHSDLLGETFYTRALIRNKGDKVYSSNYFRPGAGGYPPGSEVQVTMFSEIRVDLTINKIPHKMYPVGGEGFNTGAINEFFEKYFVKTREEIGVKDKKKTPPAEGEAPPEEAPAPAEGADAAWRMDLWEKGFSGSVNGGTAVIGMSKQQVFMAVGPPAEINFGTPAVRLALGPIMEANRWVYYSDTWFFPETFFHKVLTFADDKLISVE